MNEWIAENRFLTLEEMQHNAELVSARLSSYGFSINAIAAILGNMQTESSINPAIWENLDPFVGGYGLVQWTPYTNYSEWAGAEWEGNGDKECERINYEFENGLQYYPTNSYPISASEFKTSEKSAEYLATAFLYNYERPANLNQPNRRKQAAYWFEYLTGQPPQPEPEPEPEPIQAKINLWNLFRFGTLFNKWGIKSTH